MFTTAFLLEDNEAVVTAIRAGLRRQGVQVESAGTLGEARDRLRDLDPEVYLVDLVLPDGNGLELVRELRDADPAAPIVILTGLDQADDVIAGLASGADLYLKKPFTPSELFAHLQALHRRLDRGGAVVEFAGVGADLLHRRALRSGKDVRLTDVEIRLLAALLRAQGDVVSREDLLLDVWNLKFDPGTGLLHSHIRNLRRKLRPLGVADAIRAARGRGYSFELSESA